MTISLWHWVFAALPVIALLALVVSGKVKAHWAALIVVVLAALLAVTAFGADAGTLAVAAGKGLWLGGWILLVVWPANLLYRIAEVAGFTRIGALFASMFPNRRENLLVLAWILPSLIQGVAGFGTPIAVAAPLVLACGWSAVRSVAYPLIGYHWSVTFGSMGSSFYMASLTAHLDVPQQQSFALVAAVMLAAGCLAAGAIVLLMDGGITALRQGWRLLVFGGIAMSGTLIGVATVVPAVATVSAGGAGLLVATVLAALDRRRRDAETDSGTGESRAAWVLAPFGFLLGLALLVLLIPASRGWVTTHLVIAPSFPSTTTTLGFTESAAAEYTPLQVLGHPGTFILVACLAGLLIYRRRGLWTPVGARELAGRWWTSVRSTSVSILCLAGAATIMVQTGMIAVLAAGAARAGALFPALSPLLGALGSFLTGSSTSSNALFSAMQAQAAELLSAPEPVILGAQTAGANIGNSFAPVVILIGLAAVGAGHQIAPVLRRIMLGAVPLLVLVAGITCLLVAVG